LLKVSMLKERKQRKRKVEKTKIMENKEKFEYPHITKFKAFPSENAGILGMSLLDYFAGQAMQLMTTGTPQQRADRAYRIAEAMMEQKVHTLGDEDE
jgi:hypothetical protein